MDLNSIGRWTVQNQLSRFSEPTTCGSSLHRGTRFWVMAYVAVAFCASSSNQAFGQTFLERLESAVRERLNESEQAAQTSANSQSPLASEELPRPRSSGAQNDSSQFPSLDPNTIPSVLESRSSPAVQSSPPAAGLVPPPAAGADRRIYLGLEAEEVTGGGIGVLVTGVTQDSPAWKAGFQRQDRIMAINGFAITNLDQMVQELSKTAPGQSVKFLTARGERNLELIAVLMDAELAERIAGSALPIGDLSAGPGVGLSVDAAPWLGVMVSDLTPAFRNQFGLTNFRGAAVTTVAANSPAAKIGMVAGDAIISIGGQPIETANELMNWMNSARPGQSIDVTYQRGLAARTSKLTLEVNPESQATRTVRRSSNPDLSPPNPPNSSLYNVSPTRPGSAASTNTNPAVVPSVPPPRPNVIPGLGNSQVPNALPTPLATGTDSAEVAELRREISELKSELTKANERLESTQNRLKQILEVLGDK